VTSQELSELGPELAEVRKASWLLSRCQAELDRARPVAALCPINGPAALAVFQADVDAAELLLIEAVEAVLKGERPS
jgi:hypothetical protein